MYNAYFFFSLTLELTYAQGQGIREIFLDDSQAEPRYDSQMEVLEAKFDQAFESVRELIIFLSAVGSKM
jgi:hypothetical protein